MDAKDVHHMDTKDVHHMDTKDVHHKIADNLWCFR